MLLTKHQLAAARFSCKPDSYAFGHLKVDPTTNTIWVTNKHLLASVKALHTFKDEDFPVIPGLPDGSPQQTPMLLPATLALQAFNTIKRGARRAKTSPILMHALLRVDAGRVYVATTDLETPFVASMVHQEREFPDVDRVIQQAEQGISSGPPVSSIRLGAGLVSRICAYAESFEPKTGVEVTMPSSSLTPVRFHWRSGDHDVTVWVMPYRAL